MRVLAIIDTINVSGPGRQLVSSALELRNHGVEVTIGIFERVGSAPRPFEEFVRSRGVPTIKFSERRAFDRGMLHDAGEQIRQFQPDLIQTHGYKPSAVAWMLRRSGFRQPWLAFFHGSTTENIKVRLYHWLDQFLMKSADAVVLMSALHLKALGGRFRSTRVIHNAVLFPASPEFEHPPTKSAPPRLLVVGRLSSEKGVDVLLRACALLATQGQQIDLTVVGDGPDRQELERLAESLAFHSVHFVGHSTQPDEYYRVADLLVIPSRSEGLPNVLLEAISHGLPVVATRVGAIPEVIRDDRVGRMCPPGDIGALAEAIQASLVHRYREDGIEGRRLVLTEFSTQRRAQHLRALYDELRQHRSVTG